MVEHTRVCVMVCVRVRARERVCLSEFQTCDVAGGGVGGDEGRSRGSSRQIYAHGSCG